MVCPLDHPPTGSPTDAAIDAAVAVLRAGGVVAFPTETVYGLGADAFNSRAVARVFELKGRPAHNPVIVHVDGPAMAGRVASQWPEAADRLARRFWPGPVTLVLPRRPDLPDLVTAGGPTVAIRCPDHPVALALIRAFGGPLVGPSANPSGRVSPTTADHVRASFSPGDVVVLDGGPCARGIESTVLALGPGGPVILRPGPVGAEDLSAALGRPVALAPDVGSGRDGPVQSPGLLATHYAPGTRCVLFDSADWESLCRAATGPIVVMTPADRRPAAPHRIVRMPAEPGAYAAALYSALRAADSSGAALIAVERPWPAGAPIPDGWLAVADRLSRAAKPINA